MSYDTTRIETDYPIIDTIIDNGKKLMLDCILKDEEEANKYETLDIMRIADMYIHCMRGSVEFQMFNYSKQQLAEVGITTQYDYVHYSDIPKGYANALKKIAIRDYIANYEEQNDYYRQFCGLPPLGDPGIRITERVAHVNNRTPIHKMSLSELNAIEAAGILDKYRQMYPEAKYLNFLGAYRIDPYFIRTLPNFGVIYLPTSAVAELRSRYREKLEVNRVYALTCMYSDSMKYMNDYYDKFIAIFIKIQAMLDLLIDVPDMIIRKDIFDLRSVKYMFESSGIKYFEEIPIKYQLAMLKSMNTLLTFKSTTKNMIDICSLFGFKNIDLFKYYIIRGRKCDKNGEFSFKTTDELDPITGEYETVDDYVRNFELKFVKVPIDGILDNYIRDDNNYVSYEDMTKDDKYWNGGRDQSDVYKEIISREFNIDRSKYLSIDITYEMDKLSFELSYFFNMILDDVLLEETLFIKLHKISEYPIMLKHSIMYLYALWYEQANLEDNIVSDSPTKVLSVRGFNFQADLTKLSQYLYENKVTLKDLGIEDFTIPTSQILTFNQLTEIFLKNRRVYDHIVNQMINAENADIYNIYKNIYNALMVTDISNKVYELPNGQIASTYTEYFKYYNLDIYEHLEEIRSKSGKEKDNAISDTIVNILSTLEEYIDTSEFDFLFMNIPMAGDIIKGFVYRVIDFYKSYKVQLNKINTIYRFDDPLENRINVIDTIRLTSRFSIETINKIKEMPFFTSILKLKESIPFEDRILINWALNLKDDEDILGIQWEELITRVNIRDDDFSHFMFRNKMRHTVHNRLSDDCIPTDMIHISRVDAQT